MSRWGLVAAVFVVSWAGGVAAPAPDLAREGESLKAVCSKCHNLQMVMDTPMSYEAWHDTVQTMVDRGASGTDEQFDDVMDYLHRTMTTINVNTADVGELGIVLGVSETVAKGIVSCRGARRFSGLADLKSVAGVDGAAVNAKARLIFFK
jgi:competence protein ComEA